MFKKVIIGALVASAIFANEVDPFQSNDMMIIDGSSNDETQIKNSENIDVLTVKKRGNHKTTEEKVMDLKSKIGNVTDDLNVIAEVQDEEEMEEPAPQVVKYPKIKYNKKLFWYSIIPHDKSDFEAFLGQINLPDTVLENLRNRSDSGRAALLNALAYDYGKKDPTLAEGFYKEIPKYTDISFYDQKIRVADYYIRTGRPKKVQQIIQTVDCLSNVNYMYACDYYLGVSIYLTTGDNKNVYLRNSKQRYEKARKIYDRTN